MEILEELTQLKADYSAAQTLLEEANNSATELKAAKDSLQSSFEALSADLGSAKDALSAKQAELAEALKQIESLKTEAKSSTEKAIDITAAQGIAPIKSETPKAELTRQDFAAEFVAIKDPIKRSEYFSRHRASLFGK